MADKFLTLLKENRNKQFWLFQLAGWSVLSGIAFFVGPVWYGFQDPLLDTAVILVQSLTGLLLTIPLRFVFRRLWIANPLIRLAATVVAVILVSVAWTFLKMEIYFAAFPSNTLNPIWRDFGGWLYVAIVVIAAWTALYYGVRYYQLAAEEHEIARQALKQARDATIGQLESDAVARDAQLRMLRYQINPHFLYNTLNAACALVQANRSEAAQKMLVQLSSFFRYSLDTDPGRSVTLGQELEALDFYLEIEKVRFRDALNSDIQINESARNARVPSLILQPLFENAIKHAVSRNPEGGTIHLEAGRAADRVHLHIWDDGPGSVVEEPSPDSGDGVGLKNIRERLDHFSGSDFSFATSMDSNGGFHVKIEMPYMAARASGHEAA
mgnify:CR=1 FL=1